MPSALAGRSSMPSALAERSSMPSALAERSSMPSALAERSSMSMSELFQKKKALWDSAFRLGAAHQNPLSPPDGLYSHSPAS